MENKEELDKVLAQLEDEEEQNTYDDIEDRKKFTNVDYLNILSYINMILFIIGAAYMIITSFSDEINFVGIAIGIISLIMGVTLFFLLRTVVDIYKKLEK